MLVLYSIEAPGGARLSIHIQCTVQSLCTEPINDQKKQLSSCFSSKQIVCVALRRQITYSLFQSKTPAFPINPPQTPYLNASMRRNSQNQHIEIYCEAFSVSVVQLFVFYMIMLFSLFSKTYNELAEKKSFRQIFISVFIPLLKEIGIL